MHPSTQVTHIPENGLTSFLVLFSVKVATVAFGFVNDIALSLINKSFIKQAFR
jgi:hypothetical protein